MTCYTCYKRVWQNPRNVDFKPFLGTVTRHRSAFFVATNAATSSLKSQTTEQKGQNMKQIKIISGVAGEPITNPEAAANKWIQEHKEAYIDNIRVKPVDSDGIIYLYVFIEYEIPDSDDHSDYELEVSE